VTERLFSIRSKINNRSSSIVNQTAWADGGEGTSNIERPTSNVEVESSPAAEKGEAGGPECGGMTPLFTGRHVDQWKSSDMSEQSR
jgi:hypothetical protein